MRIAGSLVADSATGGHGGFAHVESSTLTITDNTQIVNATARLSGGAIYASWAATATVANGSRIIGS
eukprot:5370392-Prymnesium_polylepis.1